jgi:hypothetical protein
MNTNENIAATAIQPADKIIVSNYGNGLAIGLQGSKEFQDSNFTRFYNTGAVAATGDLHEVGEFFAYFLSDSAKMVQALTLANHLKMVSDGRSKLFKGMPVEMQGATIEDAEKEFDSYPREEFMSLRPTYAINDYYGKGQISADKGE